MPHTSPSEPGLRIGELSRIPYLSRQLIAYIGNKRGLLPYLAEAFTELERRHAVRTFLDPFAGSGAVSRLARYLGYEVYANDWEFYSWILVSCALTIGASELPTLFRGQGGLDAALGLLNAGTLPQRAEYISRHYAPHDTAHTDYRTERLFYTRENALFIDRVRETIELWYPGWELDGTAKKEKLILLSALLYETATHANTSGVFKACHKGFGGHGKDALSRILSPMRLEPPPLIDRDAPSFVTTLDAEEFCKGRSADLCYLDPPYTIHQYGSNYFMLNTVAKWDRPPVSDERTSSGRLKEKAGIRPDWKKTKSAFCYARTAPQAMRGLIDSIDARFICLSYNTEGLVPLEELLEIMSRRGRVELFSREYTKYRGGKQSISRVVNNLELLLVVTTTESAGRAAAAGSLHRTLAARRIAALLSRGFHPARLIESFGRDGNDGVVLWSGSLERGSPEHRIVARTERFYRMTAIEGELQTLSADALSELERKIAHALCRDRLEECRVLVSILERELDARERVKYGRRFLTLLRKFAFRKYRAEFSAMLEEMKKKTAAEPEKFGGLSEGLSELERLATLRFNG